MKTCRLKICGLSRFGDILAANDILPDYIGFVFAESSRRVTPDKAVQLRRELDKRIRAVGVFVNAPMEEILELAGHREKERVIDLIQLHGDETTEETHPASGHQGGAGQKQGTDFKGPGAVLRLPASGHLYKGQVRRQRHPV